MRRLVAIPVILCATFALALPNLARAQWPPNGTVPAYIRLVESSGGVPDTMAGRFQVVVRDIANNPIAGAHVVIDFSYCLDLRIDADQLNPNLVVDCANHTVSAWSNTDGIALFTLLGHSSPAGTPSGTNCARAYVDGWLFGSLTVAAFDLDGAGGVTVADLSTWLADLGTHVYRGRDDFDGNGTISAGDLSVWLATLGRHRSNVTGASCP